MCMVMRLPASTLDFLGAYCYTPPQLTPPPSPHVPQHIPSICPQNSFILPHMPPDEFHPSKGLLSYLLPHAPRPTVHCYCFSKADDPTADALQVLIT